MRLVVGGHRSAYAILAQEIVEITRTDNSTLFTGVAPPHRTHLHQRWGRSVASDKLGISLQESGGKLP